MHAFVYVIIIISMCFGVHYYHNLHIEPSPPLAEDKNLIIGCFHVLLPPSLHCICILYCIVYTRDVPEYTFVMYLLCTRMYLMCTSLQYRFCILLHC